MAIQCHHHWIPVIFVVASSLAYLGQCEAPAQKDLDKIANSAAPVPRTAGAIPNFLAPASPLVPKARDLDSDSSEEVYSEKSKRTRTRTHTHSAHKKGASSSSSQAGASGSSDHVLTTSALSSSDTPKAKVDADAATKSVKGKNQAGSLAKQTSRGAKTDIESNADSKITVDPNEQEQYRRNHPPKGSRRMKPPAFEGMVAPVRYADDGSGGGGGGGGADGDD